MALYGLTVLLCPEESAQSVQSLIWLWS